MKEAVVLAAGEGSRMRPLTEYQPKPMLRIGARPIVEYPLEALAAAGVERVVLVVGHGSPRIQNHLGSSYRGMDLAYVHQATQLGSGHALQVAAGDLGDEFLVVNGDNVVDERMVRRTARRYSEADAAACLAVSTADRPDDFGTVRVEDGEVQRVFEDGDGSARINAGVYAFDRRVFAALDAVEPRRGERALPDAIARLDGPVVAARPDGVWLEPTYPWDLLSANDVLLTRHRDLLEGDRVADTARVHDTAVVDDGVVVGPNCEVSAGAVLRDGTCLHENTHVGENTVVERSLLGPDSRVDANALVRDSIVGTGVEIGDGTVSPGRSASLVVDGREHVDRQLGAVVADRTTVGANAVLKPGSRIGPDATVAPGAIVREDVADGTEVIA